MQQPAQRAFSWLIAAQALHSVEEYRGAIWEVLAPARFVSGLVSADLPCGFLVINATIVAVGVVCGAVPVRHGYRGAVGIMWFWTLLELANGTGHILFAISAGGYFPGACTAPLLVLLSAYLARTLLRQTRGR